MKRQLVVTPGHDGRERAVVVEGPLPSGRVRISIDDRVYEVDANEVRPGTWSILIDQRSVLIDVERRGGAPASPASPASVIATIGSAEVSIAVEDALRRKPAGQPGAQGTSTLGAERLRAPIAGKIVKVLVAIGDTIPAHAPVIAIEAMKMENELMCERGGTVTAIHTAVGKSVERGDPLVDLA
jgi:biotin carboxyl carrier protein